MCVHSHHQQFVFRDVCSFVLLTNHTVSYLSNSIMINYEYSRVILMNNEHTSMRSFLSVINSNVLKENNV